MGYYIETGTLSGKANWILNHCQDACSICDRPETVAAGFVPVCIADNGPFEAAGIAFDPGEAKAFDLPSDSRSKQWLLIRIEDAERLNPKVKGHINWSTHET